MASGSWNRTCGFHNFWWISLTHFTQGRSWTCNDQRIDVVKIDVNYPRKPLTIFLI
ncbi:hypothetical protein PF005_g3772 [Phytophthora fragariae]|uniref:Uncharacterized protein n=1 Tax=Phytophthora fragariae TaxID=53985 RepID=A0A6A3FR17_9STRA|nr:hypothetical protein PF003_g16711 [Phytophthora fragariae]KAE8946450.1 hypothetical protein PF009_g3933 [Phytophthora fragariae]KAE9017152.1 hypothetical protein PF011_g6829 [Phytophthora fragariae]KAE9121612.1 hypothetical protein PF010_g7037 [Phytophthora fragariae]KAE9132861.1 hypothetical protein PF007_g3565 [Phytophthora fragariae]